ncbi:MAG: YqiJ family protein [Desulfobacteraceae bacterium]|nr:YqiJ family protein [Desulfobacteraceae bacterium]
MIEFMLRGENLPFMVSLTIMIMIACLEGVTTMIGMGLSSMVESFMPDFDIDADMDVDVDLDHPDISTTGILTKTFGWLRIGQVPFLIILIAFLTIFGLAGLLIQSVCLKVTGHLLPGLIASGITLPVTLPLVRAVTGVIGKIMPKDETEAVAEKSFIGRVAVITLGRAAKNHPAQAKLKDKFGTTHYIMVEPDLEAEEFNQGDQVLIVSQTSSGYKAIQNPMAALQDME